MVFMVYVQMFWFENDVGGEEGARAIKRRGND